jgi:hypothetical protein
VHDGALHTELFGTACNAHAKTTSTCVLLEPPVSQAVITSHLFTRSDMAAASPEALSPPTVCNISFGPEPWSKHCHNKRQDAARCSMHCSDAHI